MSNLHKGHRQRLRDKYLKDGFDSFNDHEALELLLYYAIPQRDTNPIAHKLLNDFGSFSAVLDAPVSYLKKSGLSDSTAAFLKMIPDFARLYLDDKNNNTSKIIDTNNLCDYFKNKFIGRTEEVLFLLLMDAKGKEVFSGVISKGSINTTDVPVRKMIELSVLYNARSVAFAHNHPSGMALPSRADLNTTKIIYDALKLINVVLVDHVIVSDDDAISLAESIYGTSVFVSESD